MAYLIVTHAPIVKNLLSSFAEAYEPKTEVKKIFPAYCSSFELCLDDKEELKILKGINDEYMKRSVN